MRCIALAEAVAERGIRVIFVCRELPGNWTRVLKSFDFKLFLMDGPGFGRVSGSRPDGIQNQWPETDQDQDAEETLARVGHENPEWLVVDHYLIGFKWENRMKQFANKIMVIDDLANRTHQCDLIIDHNLHSDSSRRYSNLVPLDSIQMLGPSYALLRSEFHKIRQRAQTRKESINRILVSFGGADLSGETLAAVRAVLMLKRKDIHADVVIGSDNPFFRELCELSKLNPGIRLHSPSHCIGELMAGADLAIGAGGVSSLERCCLGLPSVVKPIASNQVKPMKALAEAGAIDLIPFSCKTTPENYLSSLVKINSKRMNEMSRAGIELVDGLGCYRVVRRLFGK